MPFGIYLPRTFKVIIEASRAANNVHDRGMKRGLRRCFVKLASVFVATTGPGGRKTRGHRVRSMYREVQG